MLSGATIHLLENVHQAVSATAIREAVAAKKPLRKFVDAAVEEYIKKEGLYASSRQSSVVSQSSLVGLSPGPCRCPRTSATMDWLTTDRLRTDDELDA